MVKFTLNGVPQEVDAPPDMPLLWVVRDVLKLTGTKFGCGMALCGACTVHLNGSATRSCILPVGAVEGQQVRTIEGLAKGGALHPCQRAWNELSVPQCGYCQPGQLMQASSLLAANPQPTDEDINASMGGNICRCGTYPRIRAAIHRASQLAKDENVDLKAAISPETNRQRPEGARDDAERSGSVGRGESTQEVEPAK